MDLEGFSDPWEHVRLLSDSPRNAALLKLLERRAPGSRVLEIGAGSGLLSCLAARMGASKVYAVEPTIMADAARDLVARNGLEDIVEVITGRIQDLEPRPVDLAFSELLNAEPFAEEILDAMDGAAPWVVPSGLLAPKRLRVWMALVRENSSAVEVRNVRRNLQDMGKTYGLDLSPALEVLDTLEPYRFISPRIVPVTAAVCIADLALGTGARPPPHQRVSVAVEEPGPLGAAAVWFEAELDDGLVMHNAPGNPGHWGHLVLGWPHEAGGPAGGSVEVDVHIDLEDGVTVSLA